MTQTGISTAARRIVRDANAQRPGWRLYFDADGRRVAEVYGVEAFGYTGDYRLCVHTDNGGRPVRHTQRDIQRSLDARDAADSIGRPDLWTSIDRSWQDDDEAGRDRVPATEVAEICRQVDAEMRAEDLAADPDPAWTSRYAIGA